MRSVKSIQHDLLRLAPRVAASLFVVPALVWIFASTVLRQQDAAFNAATQGPQVEGMEATESRLNALAAFSATPPSSVCASSDDLSLAQFRATYCQPWSRQWQLSWALPIAKASLAAAFGLLAACAALALIAARSRTRQRGVILAGWRLNAAATVGAVIVQGAMLIWLAYWVPALFFGSAAGMFALPVALAVGIAAAGAAWVVVRRTPAPPALQGEAVTREDAPELWERVGALARQLAATPPRHIVATVDGDVRAYAFDRQVSGYKLRGPLLVMSMPLLRTLESDEALSLVAHELAYLHDSECAGANEALARFDRYLEASAHVRFGAPARVLLLQFRLLLELALANTRRDAEVVADLVAARHTSPTATARAMIKSAGYAAWRARAATRLEARGGAVAAGVNLAERVAAGLAKFAGSGSFAEAVKSASVAPPFDVRPPLSERIGSLGVVISEAEYPAIMLSRGPNSWVAAIPTVEHIERRLWRAYEAQFGSASEPGSQAVAGSAAPAAADHS